MKKIAWPIVLLLLAAPAAMAVDAEKPGNEIIYRANLGRAGDVQLLIKQGASPNQADENGAPLLSLAAARPDKEGIAIARTLLEAGASINATDKTGQTALFYAARQGNANMARYLLEQGIDYYAADDEGNIARTIAHNAGHKDIVKLMDEFVTDQTKKVGEQYKEYNETIRKQYDAIAEEEKKRAEQAAAAATQTQPAAIETDAEEEPAAEKPKLTRDSPEFEKAMHDLAFHNCAFQYWSFCRQAKQTTDLSAEELAIAIDSHKDLVLDLSKQAMKDYRLKTAYIDRISTYAKRRIVNRLAAMPSNTYRFEHGVCKMPDLKPRCEEIASTWNQEPEPVAKKKKTSVYQPNASQRKRATAR